MVKIPHKTLERRLFGQGYERIIGVDEVGMGCLAGPVVVCAASFQPEFYVKHHPALAGLRDSKLLSPARRQDLAEALAEVPGIHWQVAVCESEVIDEINIYQASRLAMHNAIAKLRSDLSTIVLVDGNKLIAGIDLSQRAIVKGDQKVFAIAAASILAKVHRDAMMVRYATRFPGYGFEQHKGYGTELHRQRIRELGPCEIHRKSFTL